MTQEKIKSGIRSVTHYVLLLVITLVMTSCAQKGGSSGAYSGGSSLNMGQGDLDRTRQSGEYYTRLNANKNRNLPKGKPYKVRGQTYVPYTSAQGFEEIGVASWYGPGFHGKLTANGEKYNQRGVTAAHKLLPFGTMVRVTNLDNGMSVVVRVNDRGPFLHGRIIDLSEGAAKSINMVDSGTAKVHLEVAGGSSSLASRSGGGFGGGTSGGGSGGGGAVGAAAATGAVVGGGVVGGLGLPPASTNRFGQNTGASDPYVGSGQNAGSGANGTGFGSSDPTAFGDDSNYFGQNNAGGAGDGTGAAGAGIGAGAAGAGIGAGAVGDAMSASDAAYDVSSYAYGGRPSSSPSMQSNNANQANDGLAEQDAIRQTPLLDENIEQMPLPDAQQADAGQKPLPELQAADAGQKPLPELQAADAGQTPLADAQPLPATNDGQMAAFDAQAVPRTQENNAIQVPVFDENLDQTPVQQANVMQAPLQDDPQFSQSGVGQTLILNENIEQAPVQQAQTPVITGQGVGTQHYIQIGAFKKEKNVTALVSFLEAENLEPQLFSSKGFRFVQVGPYSTRAEIVKIHDKLRKKFPEAYIITR